MGERASGAPRSEIAGPGDPGEQRRQAEGEAVENQLGRADPGFIAALDHRRHEPEAGVRAEAQADAQEAVLLWAAGVVHVCGRLRRTEVVCPPRRFWP